jgi:toluene monooxygenase system protein D
VTETPIRTATNMAGPLFRGGEISVVAVDAIIEDNPDKEVIVDDHRTYVRVEAEGGLIIRRATMERLLGRTFRMQELEVWLTGYSGQIDTRDDHMRWYFIKQG